MTKEKIDALLVRYGVDSLEALVDAMAYDLPIMRGHSFICCCCGVSWDLRGTVSCEEAVEAMRAEGHREPVIGCSKCDTSTNSPCGSYPDPLGEALNSGDGSYRP